MMCMKIGEGEDDGLEPQKRITPSKKKRKSKDPHTRDGTDDRSGSSSGHANKPFKPPGSLDSFSNVLKGATSARPKPKAGSKKKYWVLHQSVRVFWFAAIHL